MSSRCCQVRGLLAGAALLVMAGCGGSTLVAPSSISVHRARWVAHNLTRYAYDYTLGTGFLITFAGHKIHLVVFDGAVQSATDETTGQALAVTPGQWPTIDALFDDAEQAERAGALLGVKYDGTLDYPTEIDVSGPPDASGSIFASGLQPVP